MSIETPLTAARPHNGRHQARHVKAQGATQPLRHTGFDNPPNLDLIGRLWDPGVLDRLHTPLTRHHE
jgi:hypothetical protein